MNGGQIDCIADTSVIVGLLRKNPQIERNMDGKNFAITYVTLAELSLGVLKSSKPEAAWQRIMEIIRDRIMFHVSPNTPVIYARIYFELEQLGMMIPINDIWIATLAVETGLPILARDEHFSRIKGLTVISC
jgi:tRNA(fMet)-specific endonuclease VapC